MFQNKNPKAFLSGFGLWFAWILIMIAGVAITFANLFLRAPIFYQGFSISGVLARVLFALGMSGILAGALIGLLQWMVIRKRIDRPGRWIWATAIAVTAGWVAYTLVFSKNPRLEEKFMSIQFTVIAVVQWWLMRREVPRAYWWLLAPIVSWSFAAYAAEVLDASLPDIWYFIVYIMPSSMISSLATVLLFDRSGQREFNSLALAGITVLIILGGWQYIENTYGQQILTLRGHTGPVRSVAFSPDGKFLASGSSMNLDGASSERTIKLWDVSSGKELNSVDSKYNFNSVAFSPDGLILAAGSSYGTVRFWDVLNGQELQSLSVFDPFPGVQSLAFSPSGQLLAIVDGSLEGNAILWDLDSGKTLQTLKGSGGLVQNVAFSPNGDLLAASSETVELWEVASGKKMPILQGPYGSGIAGDSFCQPLAFSPDGRYFAVGRGSVRGFNEHAVVIWDVDSGKVVQELPGGCVGSLAFSPDGRILALGGRSESGLLLWDIVARRELDVLRGGGYSYTTLAFSPDGKLLATGSLDGVVRLWNVPVIP